MLASDAALSLTGRVARRHGASDGIRSQSRDQRVAGAL